MIEGDVLAPDLPRWAPRHEFHVFRGEPTIAYTLVATHLALSDVGDYPDADEMVQIAKRYASKHGGNGVILNPGRRTDGPKPSNQMRIIFVPSADERESKHHPLIRKHP